MSDPRVSVSTVAPSNQATVVSSDAVAMGEIFKVAPTVTDYHVTPRSAMRVSAVYACVRLLAGLASTLPVHVFDRQENGDRRRVVEEISPLLNQAPYGRFTAATFWEFMVSSVLMRGDGFSEIVRPSPLSTKVLALKPLHPDLTFADVQDGEPVYQTMDEAGKIRVIAAADVLHFPGFGFDGLSSMSVIQWGARNAISVAGSADEQVGLMIGSGGVARHVFKTPGNMSEQQTEMLRVKYNELVSRKDRAVPLVLTGGLEVETLSISAEDAQLMENRVFQVEDIARAFGVPPHLIGSTAKSTSWGTGLEEQNRAFLVYTLQPHLTRISQELNAKLFHTKQNPNRFCEFNVDAIARADLGTRMQAYREALGGSQGPGWMSVNEVRQKENLPALPDKDDVFEGHAPATGQSNENQTASE